MVRMKLCVFSIVLVECSSPDIVYTTTSKNKCVDQLGDLMKDWIDEQHPDVPRIDEYVMERNAEALVNMFNNEWCFDGLTLEVLEHVVDDA